MPANKPYILIFNDEVGSRKVIQEFVDTIPEIPFWYGCMSGNLFFTSSLSADKLYNKFKEKFGNGDGKRFMILEIGPERQGWMPKKVWYMINHPDAPFMPKEEEKKRLS